MKILFASDICFTFMDRFPGREKAREAMKDAAAYFRKADFSLINLENPIGKKKMGAPIPKAGPNLIADEEFMAYIDALAPSAVGLANNHTGDYGDNLIFNTIRVAEERNMQHPGAGRNIREAYLPAVFSKDGESVAVIAVCENEFGIAGEEKAGTAGYRLSRVAHTIKTALRNNQKPIIFFHGGNENNPVPSPDKVDLYRHFTELGAIAVIAMHTHCPQGYEYYEGKPIVYSMGNFFFPDTAHFRSWLYGYMVMLDTETNTIETIPYKFDPETQTVLEGEEKAQMDAYIEFISRPINDAALLQQVYDGWTVYRGVDDYLNGIVYDRKILEQPHEIIAKMIAGLRDMYSCEAHDELMRNSLQIIYDGRIEESRKYVPLIRRLMEMDFTVCEEEF